MLSPYKMIHQNVKSQHYFLGHVLEKVYLLAFCIRKIRKMTTNAKTAKHNNLTDATPIFARTATGGLLSTRASKKIQ